MKRPNIENLRREVHARDGHYVAGLGKPTFDDLCDYIAHLERKASVKEVPEPADRLSQINAGDLLSRVTFYAGALLVILEELEESNAISVVDGQTTTSVRVANQVREAVEALIRFCEDAARHPRARDKP